jgi:CRISPR-associated protein Cmr4
MSENKSMLYIYIETPLHAGTGRTLGAVDLPIQRERTTGYPIIQASGVKGSLRAETRPHFANEDDRLAVFGPEQDGREEGKTSSDFGGALFVGDARILLFPVRSLAGVFAWATSEDVLERFAREMKIADQTFLSDLSTRKAGDSSAWITEPSGLLVNNGQVVLEEYAFDITADPEIKKKVTAFAGSLADKAFPKGYSYWRERLKSNLCILPDDDFRDFVKHSTEVQTHIALDPDKKVVKGGALWTSESLPVDTLLYSPIVATRARNNNGKDENGVMKLFSDALDKLQNSQMQMGGDETTGQGVVTLRLGGGGA